jgi:hypothetical protein
MSEQDALKKPRSTLNWRMQIRGWPRNGTKEGAQQYFDWFKFQFWRFVFVQDVMGKELQTFLEYPPMQRGASFNMSALKAELEKKMEASKAAAGN